MEKIMNVNSMMDFDFEAFNPFQAMEEVQQEEHKPFVIENDKMADWALRRIADLQSDTATWKAYYKEQAEKIESANNAGIERMTQYLQAYFDTVPHKVTKTQENYKLPSGKLVWKDQTDEYERKDEDIIKWCADNAPECIETVQKVKWGDLKKMLTPMGEQMAFGQTGEVVPGVKCIKRERKFVAQPD